MIVRAPVSTTEQAPALRITRAHECTTGRARDDAQLAERERRAKSQPRSKKRKLPPLPASLVAHPCSVFAVDPGKLSGWSTWDRGNLCVYGETSLFDGSSVRLLQQFLDDFEPPHVLVLERPFRARFASQLALGMAEAHWRGVGAEIGFGSRRSRPVVRVYPGTWRAAVLPGTHGKTRDQIKVDELVRADALVTQHLGPFAIVSQALGPESAPGILIGRWACFAGVVLAKLPVPRKPKPIAAVRARKEG